MELEGLEFISPKLFYVFIFWRLTFEITMSAFLFSFMLNLWNPAVSISENLRKNSS